MGKQGKFNKGVISSAVIITLLFLLLSSDVFLHSNRWVDSESSTGFRQVTADSKSIQEFSTLNKYATGRTVVLLESSKLDNLASKKLPRQSETGIKRKHFTHQSMMNDSPLPDYRNSVQQNMNGHPQVNGSFEFGGLVHERLSTANKLNVSRSFVAAKLSLSDNNSGKSGDAKHSIQNDVNVPLSSPQLGYEKRLPQAVIVGAKKSGTKALLSFLSAHPLVKSCDKEVHFFDKSWAKGSNWYKEQMPPSRPGQITIEKSPRYFVSSQAPIRMLKLLPKVKLLFIFRNPTTRALSDYSHIIARKRKVLSKDGQRPTFENSIFNNRSTFKINDTNPVVDTGRYIVHLTRWMRYFSRNQMHFVDGDNIIKRPWEEITAAQRFLKLPILVNKSNFVYNKSKGFYCIRATLSNRKYGEIKCLGKNKGRIHPKVSIRTQRILNNFFKPYNDLLYKVINKNFRWSEDVS